jgi:hypothetical protein
MNASAEVIVREHLKAIQDRIRILETKGSGEIFLQDYIKEILSRRNEKNDSLYSESLCRFLQLLLKSADAKTLSIA